MLPDRVSNPGPLTYESGAQPIALRGPAQFKVQGLSLFFFFYFFYFHEGLINIFQAEDFEKET